MAAWPRVVVLLLLAEDAPVEAGFGCRISISLIAHTCAKGPRPSCCLSPRSSSCFLTSFLPCFLLQSGDIKKIKLTFKQVDSHLTAKGGKSESEHVLCILLSAMSALPASLPVSVCVCVCVACVCVRACATMINYFCIHLHTNLLPHCLPRALSGLLCQPAALSPTLPPPPSLSCCPALWGYFLHMPPRGWAGNPAGRVNFI